jgi:hypothetical protein
MRLTFLAPVLLLAACSSPTAPVADTTAAASAATPLQSHLVFQVGWINLQRGALAPHAHVDVTYDRARMSTCSNATIFSFARFSPGGEQFSSEESLAFDVPADATSVDLWFHAVSPDCDQWDSDYGRNWRFPVVATAPAPVGWAGDWGSSTNRACAHTAGVPQPITIDEYMRERSCIFIDADVWVPGTTDVSTPHPEWIQAQVEWAKDSQAPTDSWLDYQGIVGHNARFRWSVPYEVRNIADWSTVAYSFRFTTDGTTWTRIAQPSGDDWTIVRAFSLP